MPFQITSTAFSNGASITKNYACDGPDVSPALTWTGAPAGTQSFALIADDPDAPAGTWVHWVLYNLPATAGALPEGATAADLPPGTQEGINDFRQTGYGAPCPPIGRHRYFFKIYALDAVLPDLRTPTKAALEKAMNGHVLAQTQLMGTYEKRK